MGSISQSHLLPHLLSFPVHFLINYSVMSTDSGVWREKSFSQSLCLLLMVLSDRKISSLSLHLVRNLLLGSGTQNRSGRRKCKYHLLQLIWITQYNPLMSILTSMGFVINITINFIQPYVAKMKFSTLMNMVGDKNPCPPMCQESLSSIVFTIPSHPQVHALHLNETISALIFEAR